MRACVKMNVNILPVEIRAFDVCAKQFLALNFRYAQPAPCDEYHLCLFESVRRAKIIWWSFGTSGDQRDSKKAAMSSTALRSTGFS